jgi:PKD repeat protein
MSGKLKTILLTLSVVIFFLLPDIRATHIVGGDMTYRCLGDNYFEITLTFTRDCEYGADDARFDDFAIVAIYDQYYNPVNLGANGLITIPFAGDYFIDTDLEDNCEIVGDEVCVHQSVYRDTIYLLPKEGGYIFTYQRCCRNSTLRNIKDPLETGSTLEVRVTEEAMNSCNSSPVFNNWPDIYICTNRPIDFDHSATDPDGDSLVYKLFTPNQGASVQNPRPDRFSEFNPPFKKLEWADGYSENDMLGGVPLQIDPVTGFLTGIPDSDGQFVVGVLVEEYRNGMLLSTVKRDFQYNIRICIDPPIADFIAPEVLCGEDEFTVDFINTSQNADSYIWYFDYPDTSSPDKTSTEINPSYTYPNDPGFDKRDTFYVYLKATRDSDLCYDTIIKPIVAIEDELIADFVSEIEDCPGDSLDIHLTDLSVGLNPYYTIDEWNWTVTLKDGTVLTGNDPEWFITIAKQSEITVLLEIGTIEGCTASIQEKIDLIFADIQFIADPIAICIGDSTKLVANPNSDWTYTWDPEDGLVFDDPNDKSDPTTFIEQDITYYVTVTDGVCTIVDSVHVLVQDNLDIGIDGPDYICSDTVTLIATGGEPGITVFEWAENSDFDPVIAEGDTVTFYINGWFKEYFLRVKEGTGCSDSIDSIEVMNNSIDVSYPTEINYCYGLEKEITVTNNRPGDVLVFTWEDSPYIISPLDSNTVTIFSDGPGDFYLVFHVVNQFGCELSDTIHVTTNEGPPLVIENEYVCDSFKYCFTAFGGEADCYFWDFGVEELTDDVSTDADPCYEYPGPGTYTVTVTGCFPECGDSITITKEVIVPEIFELIAVDTVHFCEGESVMLSVNPTNFSMDITWFNEDGNEIGTGIMIEYSPTGDEWITVVGIDTFGCEDTTSIFLDLFEFDLSKDNPGTLCRGDTIEISVYNNSSDPLFYEWEGHESIISGLDQSTITVVLTNDHEYVVNVTSQEYGCMTQLTIPVYVSWVDIEIYSDTLEMVITKTLDLTVVGDYSPNSTIEWSTGESTETITIAPTVGGEYEYCVTVTDEFGCFDIACITIIVYDPACDLTDIFIPNAFSPNDDDDIPNNNDIFRPRGRFLDDVEITIFNRWGEEMFYIARGINSGGNYEDAYWDGTYKGEFLGPDAFAYIIRVVCEDTEIFETTGNVSIIK